jgi:hypothetical protein
MKRELCRQSCSKVKNLSALIAKMGRRLSFIRGRTTLPAYTSSVLKAVPRIVLTQGRRIYAVGVCRWSVSVLRQAFSKYVVEVTMFHPVLWVTSDEGRACLGASPEQSLGDCQHLGIERLHVHADFECMGPAS